ncbi:hypothetical protein [Xanthobacter flavus]|uniref:hypothetical protein n=1 Tax=Xanthobacter flavus TaxID=281 RepID=UPI003726325F
MTSVQSTSLISLKTDLGNAMPTAQQGPDPTFFTVLLLTDKEYLERARQVIREGDRTLAMEWRSDNGEKQVFFANDVEHRVAYKAQPMDRDELNDLIENNVFWRLAEEKYFDHSAIIAIRRDRSKNTLSDLLALTEIIHAFAQKIPTHAVVWLPYALISIESFNVYYTRLYETGALPTHAWMRYFWSSKGKEIFVKSAGLTELGLPEVEFITFPEHIACDTNVASDAIDRMLKANFIFPDGTVLAFDFGNEQGTVTFRHRPPPGGNGSATCFLEIKRLAGGRPLPSVH